MHFIDQINLKSTTRWRVLHVIQQIAHVVNACIGGSINFNQINKAAFSNLITGTTFTAGNRAHTLLAIKTFRQYSRDSRFTNTSGTAKQIGMVKTVMI